MRARGKANSYELDLSAPYYRRDGYWNGSVWMPHQWFVWKTMLDLGQAGLAFQIAQTALELWEAEVDESRNCFEHRLIEAGTWQIALPRDSGCGCSLLEPT